MNASLDVSTGNEKWFWNDIFSLKNTKGLFLEKVSFQMFFQKSLDSGPN